MLICITLRNLEVDIGVPETDATTLSESNKLEYLSPVLKKSRLATNSIANTKPNFDFPNFLNIYCCFYNNSFYKGNNYDQFR